MRAPIRPRFGRPVRAIGCLQPHSVLVSDPAACLEFSRRAGYAAQIERGLLRAIAHPKPAKTPHHWAPVIHADNLEQTVSEAARLGARLLCRFGNGDGMAVLENPVGALIGFEQTGAAAGRGAR